MMYHTHPLVAFLFLKDRRLLVKIFRINVSTLIKKNNKIYGFPVSGNILDLGDRTEYEKNFKEFNKVKNHER